MRVIAGSAKGVRLAKVPSGVRPVSDRAREGIFSSLGPDVRAAGVLDLYAGTGALAIEALSRGAARATLVERSRPALAAIGRNLDLVRMSDRAEVVGSDVLGFLHRYENEGARYTLVFLDPPYGTSSGELDRVTKTLSRSWLQAPWTLVLTRGAKSSMPVIPVDWAVARRLVYGDSLVTLFRPDPSAMSREDQ